MSSLVTGTRSRARPGGGPVLGAGRAGAPRPVGPRRCAACGQATAGRPCTNEWCHRSDRGWSVVYNVGLYDGQLRQAIVGYKYRGQVARAGPLAGLLAAFLHAHQPWFEEYDLLTAVPAFAGPGARRAWNPVGRLMSELGRCLEPGWDIRLDAVRKTVETTPMSGRSRWERHRIAEGELRAALVAGPVDLCGARVLVVDDVFTEGSTLREVARRLLLAGAEEVAGLVLARPPWAGQTAVGETAAGETAAGETAAGDMAAGERTAGEMAVGEMAVGERAAGKRAVGEMAAGQRAGGARVGGPSGPPVARGRRAPGLQSRGALPHRRVARRGGQDGRAGR